MLLAVTLTLLIPAGLYAKGKKSSKSSQPKAAATPNAPTTIANINANSITITIPGGTKTYTVTKYTTFELNGARVTIDKLSRGMLVDVNVGMSPNEVATVRATGETAGSAASSASKKKK